MVFFNFNRGIVTDHAWGAKVTNNRFEMGHDGTISNAGGNLTYSDNMFVGVSFVPTTCNLAATVERGLSRRACTDKGGSWLDGWHQDAIQLRNGIDGALVTGNKITGVMQGIGQMDGTNDLPMNNIVIRNNDISVFGFHSITVTNSTKVEITDNKVAQETGRRTVIRAKPDALVCGNKIQRPTDPGGLRC
jgi:nitrous oxidase accessory protein NosD